MESVVFIVPEMLPVPPTRGGAVETWVHEVSQRMRRLNVRVSVISRPADPVPSSSDIRYLGVAWSRLDTWMLRVKQTSSRVNPLRLVAKLVGVVSYALGVRRLLSAVDADVVYVHNEPLLTLMLSKKPGQALVLHMHNDHLRNALARLVLGMLIRKVDMIICVSDYIRRRIVEVAPTHADKLRVVLNAVDTDVFRRFDASHVLPGLPVHGASGALNVLYVGRLTELKGVHVLIEAFARLRQEFAAARLTIAGSSFFADAPKTPYEAQLVKQATPLREAIEFTGFIPHDRLRYIYSAADIVVVPSIWEEPCCLVAFEAMAAQTCVVASRVGGMPEIVADGSTGILVAPADPQALGDALLRVARDPDLRNRLSGDARRWAVDNFSYVVLTNRVAELFRSIR